MSSHLPNEFHASPHEIVAVRLPEVPAVFEARAARVRQLAPGHALEGYLWMLAHVADAQAEAVRSVGPDMDCLRLIERHVRAAAGLDLAPTLDRLSALSADVFETQAGAVLALCHRQGSDLDSAHQPGATGARNPDLTPSSPTAAIDLALAPFIAAALQVRWSANAARARVASLSPAGSTCPVCRARPVAGIVHGDHKVRYLVCMLCATRWYLPRVTCAACGSNTDLSAFALEPRDGSPVVAGVRAEACARCKTYVKHFDLEQVPHAEPFADDVATLALDLLVAEEGYARGGANLGMLGSR